MGVNRGRFEGKGAVITGGANGIGLATATELARRGARLVLADVDKPALEQAVAHLQGQGFDAHAVLCPMVVETKLISNSERIMGADYGLFSAGAPAHPGTLDVNEVARLTVDSIAAKRLYVLPHSAARRSIRKRFDRIDQTFDEQANDGWSH